MTPQEKRNAHARRMGYRNDYEYRKYSKGDRAQFEGWQRSTQGRMILDRARQMAKAEGRPFRKSDLKVEYIAARNSRPSSVRGPGKAYTDFQQKYNLALGQDWISY